MAINTGGILTPDPNEPADQLLSQLERMAQSIVDIQSRRGVRVAQVAPQTFNTSGPHALSSWGPPGSSSDPDGFFSSTNPFEPIVIPSGYSGYYLIEVSYGQLVVSGARGYVDLRINGFFAGRAIFSGDDTVTLTVARRLSSGDALKVEFFSQVPTVTVPARCRIEARRIGT